MLEYKTCSILNLTFCTPKSVRWDSDGKSAPSPSPFLQLPDIAIHPIPSRCPLWLQSHPSPFQRPSLLLSLLMLHSLLSTQSPFLQALGLEKPQPLVSNDRELGPLYF